MEEEKTWQEMIEEIVDNELENAIEQSGVGWLAWWRRLRSWWQRRGEPRF